MSAPQRPFAVYGFGSVHDTLEAEDVLKAAGVAAATIPSPAELGEVCGIAVRIAPDDVAGAEAAFSASGVTVLGRARILDF